MSLDAAGVVAGTVSTTVFVGSYLPMLVKAVRTKDLSSYSAGNLVLANVGNAVHSVYVFSLPFGPLWFLHTFYVVSSAFMLLWWWRYCWVPSREQRYPCSRSADRSAPALQSGYVVAGDPLAVEGHAVFAQPVDEHGAHGGRGGEHSRGVREPAAVEG